MKTTLLILLFSVILVSCRPNYACPGSDRPLDELFKELKKNHGFKNDITMDAEVHSYTFTVNKDVTLCAVGNQSQAEIDDYGIKLIKTDGTVLLDDRFSFSKKRKSYEKVGDIKLTKGDTFKIQRICDTWSEFITETIGPVIENDGDGVALPLSQGVLTIINVEFHDVGATPSNQGQPDGHVRFIPYIGLEIRK